MLDLRLRAASANCAHARAGRMSKEPLIPFGRTVNPALELLRRFRASPPFSARRPAGPTLGKTAPKFRSPRSQRIRRARTRVIREPQLSRQHLHPLRKLAAPKTAVL